MIESEGVLEVSSVEEYKSIILQTHKVCVLNFWTLWAPQCQHMNDLFKDLAGENPNLQFVQIEAENFPEISEEYNISAVPTFLFIKDGKVEKTLNGAKASELSDIVEEYQKKFKETVNMDIKNLDFSKKKISIEQRLKELTHQSEIVLFMKGTPIQPKCGFSRKIVDLLQSQQVSFSFFDILSDEEVRQELKQYSNWPTFPQLYVKGEFMGGLDIVKELVESGEFEKMIPKKKDLNTQLKELINSATLMIFIKGTPDQPRCGFSAQLVELFREKNFVFSSFDILSDENVRQGLKHYSNWPTFPQIYFNGELLGGLDIIKEMNSNGELDSLGLPTRDD